MLTACTASQFPYIVGHPFVNSTYAESAANTPAQACHSFVVFAGGGVPSYELREVTQHYCKTSAAQSAYPIIKLCDDTPQFTTEKIADMATLWGLFLVAAIVILCLRKLFNVFDKAPHGEN